MDEVREYVRNINSFKRDMVTEKEHYAVLLPNIRAERMKTDALEIERDSFIKDVSEFERCHSKDAR